MTIYIPKIKVRYLSISEILTIKEYWNLIDQEQLLAITWEPDFSQNVNEPEELSFYTNSRQKNDIIFLKSPKSLFWGHFWPFLVVYARCTIIWTLLLTKNEFSVKNEADYYQIKPLKPGFCFNNFSGVLFFVFWCIDYRAL